MKRALRTALKAGIRSAAAARSLFPQPHGARILTYHSVRPNGSGQRSSFVDPASFEEQIAWVVREGYQVVSLTNLAERLADRQSVPDRWVCITFDDGYADNYHHAFPVLKRYGLPATIFLVTGKIDRDPLFLNESYIQEMLEHRIEFGAHTVDHVSLSSIPPLEARRQVLESGRQLAQLTGRPASHFCYPFGHYNAVVEGFVQEAGFKTCCTEAAGTVRAGANLLRLRRAGILGTDTLQDFSLKVRGAYDWWMNTYMQVEEWRRRKRGG